MVQDIKKNLIQIVDESEILNAILKNLKRKGRNKRKINKNKTVWKNIWNIKGKYNMMELLKHSLFIFVNAII